MEPKKRSGGLLKEMLKHDLNLKDITSQATSTINRINQPSCQPPDQVPVQLSNHVCDQVSIQPSGQSDTRSVGQSDTHPGRSVREIQPDTRSVGQSDTQLLDRSVTHPLDRSDTHPLDRSVGQSDTRSVETYPEFCITKNQSIILAFLYTRRRTFTNRKLIQKATGISLGTVKDAILALKQKDFIIQTKLKRYGNLPGFEYELNSELCEKYFEENSQSVTHPLDRPLTRSVGQSVTHPLDRSVEISNSNSLLYKKTTTTKEAENILLNHPELGYWRQKGLSPKQVEEWMKVANCSFEIMIKYLCWCRFDMVDLDQEKKKSIANVFNWFFRIIEKTGAYPRPKGYKSHMEKQLETERFLCEEQGKMIQELKELKRKQWEQEREIGFWKMMNDTEGELYKTCFEQLNDLEKRKAAQGGVVFEKGMRRGFNRITDSEDTDTCS